MIEIIRYDEGHKVEWDGFIDNSKNGTFLVKRDFMDYHSDRFEDFSLMIYRKGKLISCFPANVVENDIHSHQGLTYGGFIFDNKMRLSIAEEVLDATVLFYKSQQIKNIYIKQIPSIYHKLPSNEMDYWLWRKGAEIYRKDTLLSVDYTDNINYQRRVIRKVKKLESFGVRVVRDDLFIPFWGKILNSNLKEKYGVEAVHTVDEIELLKSKFQDNIVHYNIYVEDEILAGCTMFYTETIAHAQYSSSNTRGKELGALAYLFYYIIEENKNKYRYFDFGTSNENSGKVLNVSLAEFKEGLGARTYIHEYYKLDL